MGTAYALHNAIRKYGEDVFSVETLAQFSEEATLSAAEKLFITELQTLRPLGYNLTEGGEGSTGYHHTEAARRKMSRQRRGRKLTPEWKENIRLAGLGRKRPPEFGLKIAECNRGRVVSLETRNKIRQSLLEWNKQQRSS